MTAPMAALLAFDANHSSSAGLQQGSPVIHVLPFHISRQEARAHLSLKAGPKKLAGPSACRRWTAWLKQPTSSWYRLVTLALSGSSAACAVPDSRTQRRQQAWRRRTIPHSACAGMLLLVKHSTCKRAQWHSWSRAALVAPTCRALSSILGHDDEVAQHHGLHTLLRLGARQCGLVELLQGQLGNRGRLGRHGLGCCYLHGHCTLRACRAATHTSTPAL